MKPPVRMAFKEAWRNIGHPNPGRTTWSKSIDGNPAFTAWYARDLKWDGSKTQVVFFSPPGDWIEKGTGRTYIARAKDAKERGLDCRLILLQHKEGQPHRISGAYLDERFWFVRFTKVQDDGLIEGDLIAKEDIRS